MFLFNREIPIYGICFFIAITISAVLAFILKKRKEITFFDFFGCTAYLLIGAIIGAKLLFIIVSMDTIIKYNLSFLEILKGGFVFYGGLLGGFLGIIIYGKQFKVPIKNYVDLCATVLPLGHAIGRIGCYISGCCYGVKYDGIFSHIYYESANVFTPIGIRLFPVQLLESALLFMLFVPLLILNIKNVKAGVISQIYLVSYSIIRFVVEFYRGDVERGSVLGLSTSQWISLIIILFVIIYNGKKLMKFNGEKL